MNRWLYIGGLAGAVLATLAPTTLLAQPAAPLTLADALKESSTSAFAVLMAGASADAARATAQLARSAFLPSLRVDGGVTRTTDPIGVFGTQLRQRRVDQAAFDPARLNYPDAITNVQSGVVMDVPLVNLDAWSGLRGARAAADASEATAAWSVTETQRAVVDAYFGGVVAMERVSALDTGLTAARAWVRQADAMRQQGLVTKADVLQATVRASEMETQVLEARDMATTARRRLLLLLGRTSGESALLPPALPLDAVIRAVAAGDTTTRMVSPSGTLAADHATASQRDDLTAIRYQVAAARLGVASQTGNRLPRINGFARVDWNTPHTLFGERSNWTVGVMASWSIFSGGRTVAAIDAARAQLRFIQQAERAAQSQAELEIDMTRRAVSLSLLRLNNAADQQTQAAEAQRLVALRYGGGLATIAELLAADASATQAALAHTNARYAAISAVVAFRHATAADLLTLTALESPLPLAR